MSIYLNMQCRTRRIVYEIIRNSINVCATYILDNGIKVEYQNPGEFFVREVFHVWHEDEEDYKRIAQIIIDKINMDNALE